MTRFGYTLMTEQSGPKELVRYAVSAEHVGFDFEVCSDHYSPWLAAQGHAPNAWTVLGAVAHATERVELFTYVTCPTMRYHPAVVAQQAATVQILADGRFTLGVGSGENLNEHVVGTGLADGRSAARTCCARPSRSSANCSPARWWTGRATTSRSTPRGCGTYPTSPSRSPRRCRAQRSSRRSPHWPIISSPCEPDKELVDAWHAARASGTGLPGDVRVIGQIPICWDPDRDAAVARAHDQFRWFAGGWAVNADLPTTAGFAGATQFVRPEDVAESIPCGPDLDAIVEAVREYWEAGFTDIALVQIGDESQELFLKEAAEPLLEKLRSASA